MTAGRIEQAETAYLAAHARKRQLQGEGQQARHRLLQLRRNGGTDTKAVTEATALETVLDNLALELKKQGEVIRKAKRDLDAEKESRAGLARRIESEKEAFFRYLPHKAQLATVADALTDALRSLSGAVPADLERSARGWIALSQRVSQHEPSMDRAQKALAEF